MSTRDCEGPCRQSADGHWIAFLIRPQGQRHLNGQFTPDLPDVPGASAMSMPSPSWDEQQCCPSKRCLLPALFPLQTVSTVRKLFL